MEPGAILAAGALTEGLKALTEMFKEKETTTRRLKEIESGEKIAEREQTKDAIIAMGSLLQDFCKTVQVENTKREQIQAAKDVALKKLESQKNVILKYLEIEGSRRSKVIDGLFGNIEKVLNSGSSDEKVKLLGMFLDSLNTQIKEPLLRGAFADPKASVQAMLLSDEPEEF